jgi:hypothetical protein
MNAILVIGVFLAASTLVVIGSAEATKHPITL